MKSNPPKRHDAKLEGFGDPLFPPILEELAETMWRLKVTDWNSVDELRKLVSECSETRTYTTSDDYRWRASLQFGIKGAQVVILFPNETAETSVNGDKRDRVHAMYLYGAYNEEAVNEVIAKLIAACPTVGQRKERIRTKYLSGFLGSVN